MHVPEKVTRGEREKEREQKRGTNRETELVCAYMFERQGV